MKKKTAKAWGSLQKGAGVGQSSTRMLAALKQAATAETDPAGKADAGASSAPSAPTGLLAAMKKPDAGATATNGPAAAAPPPETDGGADAAAEIPKEGSSNAEPPELKGGRADAGAGTAVSKETNQSSGGLSETERMNNCIEQTTGGASEGGGGAPAYPLTVISQRQILFGFDMTYVELMYLSQEHIAEMEETHRY